MLGLDAVALAPRTFAAAFLRAARSQYVSDMLFV